MIFADIASDLVTALEHQGPYVLLFIVIFVLGYRNVWGFTSQFEQQIKLKDEMIAQLQKNTQEVMELKDAEIARLQEERTREREEREMYRQYTFRLLETTRQSIPLVTEKIVSRRGQQT